MGKTNNNKVVSSKKVVTSKKVTPKTTKTITNGLQNIKKVGNVKPINKPILNGSKPSNFTLVNSYSCTGSVVNNVGVKVVLNHTVYTVTNPVMLKNRGIVKYMVLVPNNGKGKTIVFGNFKSGNTGLHNHLPTKFINLITNQHNQTLLNKLSK